jgi:phospholipid transport system transporter-binding protein
MNKTAQVALMNDQLQISGDLCFANVMSIYEQSLAYLKKSNALAFDFSKVTSSDSSGLALVMEWIKFAKKNNKSIQISHLTEDLLSIAKSAGILTLLPTA